MPNHWSSFRTVSKPIRQEDPESQRESHQAPLDPGKHGECVGESSHFLGRMAMNQYTLGCQMEAYMCFKNKELSARRL